MMIFKGLGVVLKHKTMIITFRMMTCYKKINFLEFPIEVRQVKRKISFMSCHSKRVITKDIFQTIDKIIFDCFEFDEDDLNKIIINYEVFQKSLFTL